MKIWVDDEREPPTTDWVVCRSYEAFNELIYVVVNSGGRINSISFDHDMGPGKTGYDAMVLLENMAVDRKIKCINEIYVHTANPSVRKKMEQCAHSISNNVFPMST